MSWDSMVNRASVTRDLTRRLRGLVPGGWNGDEIDRRLMPVLDELGAVAVDQSDRVLATLMVMAEFLTEEYEAYETETDLADFMECDLAPAIAFALAGAVPSEQDREVILLLLKELDATLEQQYCFTPFAALSGGGIEDG